MTRPLVSIIIPAHNAARWIAEAIDSALRQSWPETEIIVVDDGSTDDTPHVVRSCTGARVRLVTQENRGAGAARNRGFAESRGDLIQYLDADDLLDPKKIKLQVSALASHGQRTVASGEWARFADSPDDAVFHREPAWISADAIDWLVTSLSGGGMMQPAAWLTPRALIEEAGPWDETLSLHDDGEFFARVLLRSARIIFVPGARVYYRDVANSLSRRRSRRAVESALRVCTERHRLLLDARDNPAVRRALATQYAQFAYEHRVWPDLANDALAAIDDMGVEPHPVIGGGAFRFLSSTLGFRTALRIRRWS